MSRRNIGSNFDDFLEEEGILDSATAVAVTMPRELPDVVLQPTISIASGFWC